MPGFASPRVQFTEIDLSHYVTSLPTSVGVMVVTGRRGSVVPVFVDSTRKFRELFTFDQNRVDRGNVGQYSALAFLENGYSGLWVVRAVPDDVKFAYIVVNRSGATSAVTVPATGLAVQADREGYVDVDWTAYPDGLFAVIAWSPGVVGNNLAVRVLNVDATNHVFTLVVDERLPDGSIVERFSGVVSTVPGKRDGFGNSIYIEDVLKNNDYVRVEVNPALQGGDPREVAVATYLAGGDDGGAVTDGIIGSALEQFKNTEKWDVDLIIQGGVGGNAVALKVIDVAEKRGDAVGLVDVPLNTYLIDSVKTWKTTNFNVSSSYGMAFAPWLKVYDYGNDVEVFLPPSGVVAGMMAKIDYELDPWWVPAGLTRGKVNVLGLRYYYSLAERDELDKIQINTFIRKPGVIALWNNRTLQTQESYFSFIEVRRLLNYIKKNVCRVVDAFLFEPLTDYTRERLVAMLTDFLDPIKRRMGLMDYMVKSDPLGTGNNPSGQVDQGMLTVEMYLKPVRAIRYIWLKAIVVRSGVKFEESII